MTYTVGCLRFCLAARDHLTFTHLHSQVVLTRGDILDPKQLPAVEVSDSVIQLTAVLWLLLCVHECLDEGCCV